MSPDALRALLTAVAAGQRTPDEALATLQDPRAGYVDLGFARVDLDRARRRGIPEVIFSPGKTPEHIAHIARALFDAGQRVLATRLAPDAAATITRALDDLPVVYDAEARCLYIQTAEPEDQGQGTVLVVSAGTSDRPVAAEAALVARLCGNTVETLADVGVAGLHRLLAEVDRLRAASVVIVVAGMEGALPSVVTGLVDRPVIGVPTSVGYGASFGGVSALLGMLNSCASGLTVVNIDNGFGAAYAATLINRR
ncbi:MAG: nickel pincer cofactor biosynthesis protein LarB [Myxococcales bacterium]|nr:nickel pincer cofactor biosynthesis protein LarB [Myxococcales bacterium]